MAEMWPAIMAGFVLQVLAGVGTGIAVSYGMMLGLRKDIAHLIERDKENRTRLDRHGDLITQLNARIPHGEQTQATRRP